MPKETARHEMIGLTATCSTGELNDLVHIIGDEAVALADGTKPVIGYIWYKDKIHGYTIETYFSKEMDCVFSETVTAGDFVKIGTPSGTTQRFAKWVDGTDAEWKKIGICWVGGAADETGTILL